MKQRKMQFRGGRRGERGSVLIIIAVTLVVLLGFAGMSVDALLAYMVRSRLESSVSAAVLAAARAETEDREHAANALFNNNFPAGYLGTTARSKTLNVSTSGVSMTGQATLPAYFARIVGTNSFTVKAAATANFGPSGPSGSGSGSTQFLLIDEDTLDNGLTPVPTMSTNPIKCGNNDSAKCVNDDVAALYYRGKLFTRGFDVTLTTYVNQTFRTGQVGDEGLFKFTNPDPQVSNQNNAKMTSKQIFDSTGPAANENNLDKMRDVIPLRAAEIGHLVGKTVCALVFDSDISIDYVKHEASLKGATLGLTAFVVNSVGTASGSNLPPINVTLISSANIATVCANPQPIVTVETTSEAPPYLIN